MLCDAGESGSLREGNKEGGEKEGIRWSLCVGREGCVIP